jgi:hypothetical protein
MVLDAIPQVLSPLIFRRELDEIKPVFMLAEWESRDVLKNAFDMEYSWSLFEKNGRCNNEK